MTPLIRPVIHADAAAIAGIYNHYVLNTIVTFEEETVPVSDMVWRFEEVAAAKLPWFVAVEDGKILGYAYANKWKSRCAYRYSVEATVYLDHTVTRRGVGTVLYTALLTDLRKRGLHSVIGGVALPNEGSVALHEKLGFQKIGQFREVGWKLNQWIDVGYWELML